MQQKVNKLAVARAFGRAAHSYDDHAEIQRQSGELMLSLFAPPQPISLLDAGCGTGWFSRRWRALGHQVIALDLSAQMLRQAQAEQAADDYVLGDIDHLPLPAHCVDLSWSNLALQWCDDLAHALNELCRVTRPGGTVLFSTLAAESLREVGEAWRAVDDYPHVNQFLTSEQIHAAMGQRRCRLHSATLSVTFPDVLSAMRSLKGIGATHLHQGRATGVLTRQRLQQLAQHWPCNERGYVLSYQVVFGVISL